MDTIRQVPRHPHRHGSKDSFCSKRSLRCSKFTADLYLIYMFKGQFLPWHRYFMKSYENALRNECGYKGTQPYVSLLDCANMAANRFRTVSAIGIGLKIPILRMCKSRFRSCLLNMSYYYCRISKSPIWDPLTGFGGDGVPGTYVVPTDPDPTNSSKIVPRAYRGCVKDGPFADYTLKLGPGLLVTEHCIARGVNNSVSIFLNSSTIAYTLSFPTFEQFRVELEGTQVPFVLGPHGGGHGAVGGEMTNFFSSPGGIVL